MFATLPRFNIKKNQVSTIVKICTNCQYKGMLTCTLDFVK